MATRPQAQRPTDEGPAPSPTRPAASPRRRILGVRRARLSNVPPTMARVRLPSSRLDRADSPQEPRRVGRGCQRRWDSPAIADHQEAPRGAGGRWRPSFRAREIGLACHGELGASGAARRTLNAAVLRGKVTGPNAGPARAQSQPRPRRFPRPVPPQLRNHWPSKHAADPKLREHMFL